MSDPDPTRARSDQASLNGPPIADDPDERRPQDRVARLEAGADDLRDRSGASLFERSGLLLFVAATLVTLGLSLVIVGWAGASRSIHDEEQIPYLISGGILGGTVAIIGALCLVAHWLTVGIREARAREQRAERRHAELLEALRGSDRPDPTLVLDSEAINHVDADSEQPQRPLRASPRRP